MRILSVDYGTVRTGIAISDFSGTIATPLDVIRMSDLNILATRIAELASKHETAKIIIGDPINMNGTRGEKCAVCEKLAEKLRNLSAVPVTLWDERLSTVSAHLIMNENNCRNKKRSEKIDSVAAALILESYLGYSKNRKAAENEN